MSPTVAKSNELSVTINSDPHVIDPGSQRPIASWGTPRDFQFPAHRLPVIRCGRGYQLGGSEFLLVAG